MDSRAWRYTGLQIAIVGLEGMWLALMAMVLSPTQSIRPGVLVVIGTLTLAWNRWLLAQAWSEQVRARLLGLTGMLFLLILGGWAAEPDVMGRAAGVMDYSERVAVLLESKPLLVAWLALIAMMVQVLLLLRRQLSLERAVARIRTSTLMALTAMALLHGIGTSLTWIITGLVGCALVVMPLARAIELARERSAGGMPFTPRWVGTLAVGIGCVLALGLWADAPLESSNFSVLYGIIGIIQKIAVYLLAFFIEIVVYGLVPVAEWLLELYRTIIQTIILPWLNALLFGPEALEARLQQVDSSLLQLLAVALLIITFLLPIVVIWHLYRLFKLGAQGTGELSDTEEAALAGAWYDWWKAQQDALRRLWARLQRRRFGVDTVRDLYKNLLLFGDNHQLPRLTAKTPYEYLEPLCRRYPELVSEFHAITDAYVAVKYGEHDFSELEVRRLQYAWERISTYQEKASQPITPQGV